MDIDKIFSDNRSSQAHIGMTGKEFFKLLPFFESACTNCNKSKSKTKNIRNAGRKSKLDTMEKRLFYALYYLKAYPTFDILGGAFGMDRGTACKWAHRYVDVLRSALKQSGALPKRKFKNRNEFIDYFPELKIVITDGTERRRRRPKNSEKQKEFYSGKKNAILSRMSV
jgi:hypothetical protein